MPEVSGSLSTSISGIVAISGIILQPRPGSGQEQIPLCPSPAYPSTPTSNQTAIAAAVSYWTETIGAHIIEYDSVNKEMFHKVWSTEDDTCFDADHYTANLRKDLYKNGFAVRTGKLNRGQYKDHYLICIDVDSLEAFLAWCGDEYDLASLGKWTRVDWHKNPARIHVFFISKTPLKDLAQSKDNKIIEVYGEKPHVVCVYGNHFDGNPIMPYETEKIAVLDDITRLEIENRLVIPSYLDNDAVNKYVKELEKPETIVKGFCPYCCKNDVDVSLFPLKW